MSKPTISRISGARDYFSYLSLIWRMFFAVLTNRWDKFVDADWELEKKHRRFEKELDRMVADSHELEKQGLSASAACEVANQMRLSNRRKKADDCELFCQDEVIR